VSVPLLGQGFRGVEGRSGFLLRQAWRAFEGAIEAALQPHGLTPAQYGALSVLARVPGASGADLARGSNTTPQAMNSVVATLEREGLVERHPHPTHGRILQVTLTAEGQRRLEAAHPAVRALEEGIEADLAPEEIATVKRWLVASAEKLQTSTGSKTAGRGE
jgi:DNA-binding MarR family transcriptional regulator